MKDLSKVGFVDVEVDGVKKRIVVPNADKITAVEMNDLLVKNGIDTHRVSAMTVCDELLARMRRADHDAEQLREARTESAEWRFWWEQMRERFDGMFRHGRDDKKRAVRWSALEEVLPWPSLEDEIAEGWEDE
jgi:hypothetical protein